ncbi:MAG: hypothetical protein ACXWKG_16415 [Limisphaerales bacterium]
MDPPTSIPPRPKEVTIAIILIAISFLLVAVESEQDDWRHLGVYVSYALTYFFLWLLYRRKNWVRWLFVVIIGLMLLRLPSAIFISKLQHYSPFVVSIVVTHDVLKAVALVLLVRKPSNEWFKAKPGAS